MTRPALPLLLTLLASAAARAGAADAPAGPAIAVSATYIGDVIGPVAGGSDPGAEYLDRADLVVTADLGRVVGWRGATFHLDVLNSLGGRPNDRAGTLQGVDNIEVGTPRLRVFEAWIEQAAGDRASVRLGLYDLNTEFYQNDAAALLIAPAFGIGSEMAATGPNGPSIFPLSAFAVRVNTKIGAGGYARAAVLNANAGALTGKEGAGLKFDNGVLVIAEAGIEGDRKLALGVWGYTDRRTAIRPPDGSATARQQGAYLLVQQPLAPGAAARPVTAFLRAGISEGRTTPFKGGWQTGILVGTPLKGRPDSQFSAGFNQAFLSKGFRRNLEDEGTAAARSEFAFELTYSDSIAPFLTLQPDVQIVFNPGGDARRGPVTMLGLRAVIALGN